MAFTNYGPGNWSVGGFRLPELGLTEKYLKGNTASVKQSALGPDRVQYGPAYSGAQPTTSNGQVAGASTVKGSATTTVPTSTNTGSSISGSNKSIDSEINNYYNQGMGFLDKQEQALRASQAGQEQQAVSPFESALSQAQTLFQTGKDKLSQALNDAGQQGESALSQARRLYQEYNQRNNQMFGGAQLSSAGQAASEYLGREAQRQFGAVRQNTQNAMASIGQQQRQLELETQNKMQDLELQKQNALNQAKQIFQDKLMEINNNRLQLGQNKSNLKIQALKELRDQYANINAQATQFAQQIELQRQQYDLQLRNQLSEISARASAYGDTGDSALNDLGTATGEGLTSFAGNQSINQSAGYAPALAGRVKSPYDNVYDSIYAQA